MGHVLLSVLIASIDEREEQRNKLVDFLSKQTKGAPYVEILVNVDNGEASVGDKRNALMEQAKGEFVVFIDDDDWVADDYLDRMCTPIAENEALDCVGLIARVRFTDNFIGTMICSTLCRAWTEVPGLYTLPPCHINPIRRSKAKMFKFRDVDTSEDHFWSLALANSRLIQSEVFVGPEPMYFYQPNSPKRGL
jgi:glycosyltransferase involved in cell wall biosynthesis